MNTANVHTDRPALQACELCGAIHRPTALAPGESLLCGRCGGMLRRYTRLQSIDWLALTLTAALLLLIANVFPVAELSIQGLQQSTTLMHAIWGAWIHGHQLIAILCAMAALIMPALQVIVLLHLLWPLSRGRLAAGFRPSVRLLGWLRPWSMIPVFVLAVMVALVKLAGLAHLELGAGFWGFALATIVLTIVGRITPRSIWREAERLGLVTHLEPDPSLGKHWLGCHACGLVQNVDAEPAHHHTSHCRRCTAPLHRFKPDSISRPWALLIAAIILYIPANTLPIMQVQSPIFGDSTHTILGGVIELASMGSWDLALVVFVASIVVPLSKMLVLGTLLIGTQCHWGRSLRARTRLYQAVEFVGQWSMLDVFVVLLLAALANFAGLMVITVGPAAGAFGLVVVLTMLSAMSFDPRLAWSQSAASSPTSLTSPAQ